jgi:hypothetical protein
MHDAGKLKETKSCKNLPAGTVLSLDEKERKLD